MRMGDSILLRTFRKFEVETKPLSLLLASRLAGSLGVHGKALQRLWLEGLSQIL